MLPNKRRAGRQIRKQRRVIRELGSAFSALGDAASRTAKQFVRAVEAFGEAATGRKGPDA